MASFLRSLLPLFLGIILPLGLQLVLSSKIGRERRARGWSKVSWAFALYAVGPLSMIPFCWVTRRHRGLAEGARALGVGVLWTCAILILLVGVDELYATLLGLEP